MKPCAIGTKTTSKCFRLDNIQEYSVFDEVVLYCPEREMAFSLNASARAVWELCDGKYTVLEIGQELGRRLGCSTPELLSELISDVKAAVFQLNRLGLLRLVEVHNTDDFLNDEVTAVEVAKGR